MLLFFAALVVLAMAAVVLVFASLIQRFDPLEPLGPGAVLRVAAPPSEKDDLSADAKFLEALADFQANGGAVVGAVVGAALAHSRKLDKETGDPGKEE